jgi:hydroxyethylthiazole kinase
VDSTASAEAALQAARQLSGAYGCAVCVSGATDYVVHDAHLVKVHNGHPLMSRVTGLGCTATALCGAFAAVNDSPLAACAHGMAVMGIAGEMAAERSTGPGSLQTALLDALHNLGERDIAERLRVEV